MVSAAEPARIGKDRCAKRAWACMCDCGLPTTVLHEILVAGRTKSCGCAQGAFISAAMKKRPLDIGTRYGRLVVTSVEIRRPKDVYTCRCDCGNDKAVTRKDLLRGHVNSCGCLADDSRRARCGSANPSWKPELTAADREHRVRTHVVPGIAAVRDLVFARDYYTCAICQRRGGVALNAHHIMSWAGYPELRLSMDNMVTLCVPCHRAVHRRIRGTAVPVMDKETFLIWAKK